MKLKVLWLSLSMMLAAAMLLASCGTTSTPTVSTTTTNSTTLATTPTNTTNTPKTTSNVTTGATTSSGKWWEKLGAPQYGGVLNIRINKNVTNWDPYRGTVEPSLASMWMEQPTATNWTLDPVVFDYTIGYLPPDYAAGFLASSWEFTDSTTYVLHIKQGIHYQNISPANGREMTAADIVYHYHRLFGGGDGFTAFAPAYTTVVQFNDLISVTATDKYTVTFK